MFVIFVVLLIGVDLSGGSSDECYTNAVLRLTREVRSVEKISKNININAKTLIDITKDAIEALDKVEPAYKEALKIGKEQADPTNSDLIMTSKTHDFFLLKSKASPSEAPSKCGEDQLEIFNPKFRYSELKRLGKILKTREPAVTKILIETEAVSNAISSKNGAILSQPGTSMNDQALDKFNNYLSTYDFANDQLSTTHAVTSKFDTICQRDRQAKVFTDKYVKSFETSAKVFLKRLKAVKTILQEFEKLPSVTTDFIEPPYDETYNITLNNEILANILAIKSLTYQRNWLNINYNALKKLEELIIALTNNFERNGDWFHLRINDLEQFRTFLGWSKDKVLEPDVAFKPLKMSKGAEIQFCYGTAKITTVSKTPKLKEYHIISKLINSEVLKHKYLIQNNGIEYTSMYGLKKLSCIRENVCVLPENLMVPYKDKRCALYVKSLNADSIDKKYCEFEPSKQLVAYRVGCAQSNAIINAPTGHQITAVCNLTNAKQVKLPKGTTQFSSGCAFTMKNVQILKPLEGVEQTIPEILELFDEFGVDHTLFYGVIGGIGGCSFILSIVTTVLCYKLKCCCCCKCKKDCPDEAPGSEVVQERRRLMRVPNTQRDFEMTLRDDSEEGGASRRSSISISSRPQPATNPHFSGFKKPDAPTEDLLGQ